MRHTTLAVALAPACQVIDGNGDFVDEPRQVADFAGVANTTSFDVHVDRGDPAVTIHCDDNLVPYIRTRVDGGTLQIEIQERTRLRPTRPCSVDVSTLELWELVATGSGATDAVGDWPAVDQVTNTGSGALSLQATAADLGEATLTGSGALSVRGIVGDRVSLTGTGSGTLQAGGAAHGLDLTSTGSGGVDAGDLLVSEAVVTVSGSGDVSVNVLDDLSVTLTGSGNVHVAGGPHTEAHDSGSGDVIFDD